MLQRKPDITAASMTNMKPQNSNAVSFATAEVEVYTNINAIHVIYNA